MGSSWMLVLAGFGIILVVVLTTNMLAPQFAYSEVASAPRKLLPTDSVLVTGGAGFVGFHLASRLKRDGVRVVAIDDFNPYYSTALKRARAAHLRKWGVEVLEGDICDAELLGSLFVQHGLTHVAHLAAQAGVRYSLSNPQSYMRNNLQCFISLLETHRRFPKVNPNHNPHP